jgi:acyl-CoA reductase-like NAD-dependent aldehyde dehydrogenase
MTQIYIDGAFVDPSGEAVRSVTNPATGKPLADIADGSGIDIDRAVTAAQRASADWFHASPDVRQNAMRASAVALRDDRPAIEAMLVAEGGLTQREARASFDAAAMALEMPHSERAQGPTVRAVLGPSSSPLLPVMRDLSRALSAGETVVMKPCGGTALSLLAVARAWRHLPNGVVNVVPGDAATGQILLVHAGVDAVAFTGSPAVARGLVVGERPARIDTGGEDAAIVRRDADLDAAVRAIAWSRLRHGGRACASSRRIYVDAAIAMDFTIRLHEYLGVLEVDDPAKATSMMGPLLSAAAAKSCEGRVVKSMREGARLVLGGFRFRPAGLAGYWLQQTILADVPPGTLPMREEMSGPVLTVSSYTDERQVLEWLSSPSLPLGISAFGADEESLLAWLTGIPATAVWVNVPQSDYDIAQPASSPTVFRSMSADARVDYYEHDSYPRGIVAS